MGSFFFQQDDELDLQTSLDIKSLKKLARTYFFGIHNKRVHKEVTLKFSSPIFLIFKIRIAIKPIQRTVPKNKLKNEKLFTFMPSP